MSEIDTSRLQTELRNPRTAEMDALSTADLTQALHAENFVPAEAVQKVLPEIATAIDAIADRIRAGGRLFYVGAGTSGRLGVLDASECPPTFGVDPQMVQGVIAGGDFALRNSVEGAEDDPESGSEDAVGRGVSENDVVVGIAASGRTPYVIGALHAANRAGAYTIAVVNVEPSEMREHADLTIAAVTGPEALTGSTRLKAGTAQKLVLNLLSTGAMVRLNKTYGNLMVDVRASNLKLRDRAARIVMAATDADRSTALRALDECEWHAKTAIVMLKCGIGPVKALALLEAAGGSVRAALETE